MPASPNEGRAQLVVISGVSSGIGRSLYRAFLQKGYTVAGCGRRRERLDALAAECGGDASVVDVRDECAVKAWAYAVHDKFGAPAIVIANAGVGGPKVPAWEMESGSLAATMSTNLYGVHHMARAFVPQMLATGRGAFISISSGSGRSTGATKTAYSSSKFAVEAYTKCLAHALPAPLVAVPLAPGTLQTELNPSSPVPTSDEWAVDAVPFIVSLCNPAKRHAVHGASLSVPGYYARGYVDSWIIRDSQPLLPEAKGSARFVKNGPRKGRGRTSVALGIIVVAAVAAALLGRRGRATF